MLTRVMESYDLVRVANGSFSIRAVGIGETFHPVIGPVAEAEALYLGQLRLRQRLAESTAAEEEFVVWDVGLGAAANVLTVLRGTRDLDAAIRIVSFDRTVGALRFALEHARELEYIEAYRAPLERLIAEGRAEFSDGLQNVCWDLVLGDFPNLLRGTGACQLPKPHAILFDAFSPARNPEMWTLPLFRGLFRLLDPVRPCAMPTYSRSTLLRVTLLLAGFYVGAGRATGEKEETTLAANSLELLPQPLDRAWLRRALHSTSAEPLTEGIYRQAPLTLKTREALEGHPQFGLKPGLEKAAAC